MSYRVEIAPSNRAGCQNTECKKEGIKILKGDLRCGVFVTIMDNQTWKWKHWGCVTPKQIVTINEAIENDVNLLDGLEELSEDLRDKVKTALAEGHVGDDDWRGDAEMNRPGMNGYRTPASKKAKREEAKAEKETQVAEGGESANPSKPPSKKRIKSNTDSGDEAAHDQQPASKKRKAAPKKPKKATEEDENDACKDGLKPAKRGRKNAEKPKADLGATFEAMDEDSGHGALPAAPSKKLRAPRNSVQKIKDEGIENIASSETPKQGKETRAKRRRAPRQASATKRVEKENSEVSELSDAAAGDPGPAKSHDDDDDGSDLMLKEDATEAAPMSRKRGKKATRGKETVAASVPRAKPKAEEPSKETGKLRQMSTRPKRGQTS